MHIQRLATNPKARMTTLALCVATLVFALCWLDSSDRLTTTRTRHVRSHQLSGSGGGVFTKNDDKVISKMGRGMLSSEKSSNSDGSGSYLNNDDDSISSLRVSSEISNSSYAEDNPQNDSSSNTIMDNSPTLTEMLVSECDVIDLQRPKCREKLGPLGTGNLQSHPNNDSSSSYDDNMTPCTSALSKPFGTTSCPRALVAANFSIPYTGLLTFPGSGNTWTRHLLQELTGIPTGSTSVPDMVLMKNGFPFEGRRRHVVAVKSHGSIHEETMNYVPTSEFSRLIVVLRNPYNCFLAEYKRRYSRHNHTANVRVDSTKIKWKVFLRSEVKLWLKFYRDTFVFPGPIFLMFYEDMTSNLLPQLIRLAQFLTSDDISEFSFCCALENQTGNFRRPRGVQTVEDIFTDWDRKLMNSLINRTAILLEKRFPKESRRFYSYLLQV